MRYSVRINKRVRNTQVYKVIKKSAGNPNLVTKFFMKVFAGRKKEAY
jgi:hypothetical protein